MMDKMPISKKYFDIGIFTYYVASSNPKNGLLKNNNIINN